MYMEKAELSQGKKAGWEYEKHLDSETSIPCQVCVGDWWVSE